LASSRVQLGVLDGDSQLIDHSLQTGEIGAGELQDPLARQVEQTEHGATAVDGHDDARTPRCGAEGGEARAVAGVGDVGGSVAANRLRHHRVVGEGKPKRHAGGVLVELDFPLLLAPVPQADGGVAVVGADDVGDRGREFPPIEEGTDALLDRLAGFELRESLLLSLAIDADQSTRQIGDRDELLDRHLGDVVSGDQARLVAEVSRYRLAPGRAVGEVDGP
jgi:hypothetical protein